MAHSKQAKKRIVTNAKRALRNQMRRSAMRTHIKKVMSAVASGDKDLAAKEFVAAQKQIDKAAKSRVVHPNNAARKISSLSRSVASMA